MLKNQKGITLVALVVTIVILIILATISISVALNGGIVDKATDAKEHQANASAEWQQQEANLLERITEIQNPTPAADPNAVAGG